jgi:flavin-dependent dehydrogenase
MWDAIVAGAGPAGAVAAFMLSRNGHRVLLADKIGPSALKIGEALPGAAVRLLRSLDLPAPGTGGPHAPIGGNLSSWNSEALVATDFVCDPYGPGWRLDRLRFDAELRAAAVGAGAIYRSAHVRALQQEEAGWQISFDDGHVERARWIVEATGRRATIARRLGIKRMRDARLVALYATGRASPEFQLNRTLVEAAPEGWWYAARLPSGDPIAGFHTHAREAASFNADPSAWKKALARTKHVDVTLRHAQFDRPLRAVEACGARLEHFNGDAWIACGDAAMSFDPISGQGIFSALHDGMAAGLAAADALNRDVAKLEEYSTRMENVWSIYRTRSRAIYKGERRWAAEPFWSMFGQCAARRPPLTMLMATTRTVKSKHRSQR